MGRTGRRLLYRANTIGMEEEDSQLVWQQSFLPLTDFLFGLSFNIVSAQYYEFRPTTAGTLILKFDFMCN